MGRQPYYHRQLRAGALVWADVCNRLLDRLQHRGKDVQARGSARALARYSAHLCRRGHYRGRPPRPRILLSVGLLQRPSMEDSRHLGGWSRKPRRCHRHYHRSDSILDFYCQAQSAVDFRPPHRGHSPRGLPHTYRQPYEQRDFRPCHRPAVGLPLRALK